MKIAKDHLGSAIFTAVEMSTVIIINLVCENKMSIIIIEMSTVIL